MNDSDEFVFVGFDCAYRTLGWCVMSYNPASFAFPFVVARTRNLLRLIGSGVIDVLGDNIDAFDCGERAAKLHETLVKLVSPALAARAIVIIERQPRKRMRGGGVHDTNQTIESQIVYHFSTICKARGVYLISATKKNQISAQILHELPAQTYATRKKQTRRAYEHLSRAFNFDAHVGNCVMRHIKPDQADACLQIIAAIFLCTKDINKYTLVRSNV